MKRLPKSGRGWKAYLVITPLAVIAGLLFAAGCTVGPRYSRPSVQVPPVYKETGAWKQAQPSEQALGGEWWTMFNDPRLNSLQQQVNVSNQNLKAAEAQFRQARAILRYNRADYYPTITGGASATRAHTSHNRQPSSTVLAGRTYTDLVLPVDLSYQADVWGRVRRTVEASREQAQASAADLAAVNLAMHADLALYYFQARSLDAEEQLLNSTVSDYERALQLTQNRFQGGLASALDVEQARTQLQATRAQAIDVGVLRAQYEHALATLIGTPAPSFTLAPLPLATPPPSIPPGLPSELLERRPDIAAGERRVAAANAQVGIATSAYYPVLNLAAAAGFESGRITTLISGPSILWSAGPAAAVTLFDVGRRRAVSEQARAAYDQAVANYRQTVLTGFQQVEDQLTAITLLQQEAQVQGDAVAAAQKALTIATNRYKGGVTSYLEVITAQNAALSNEVSAVNILGRRMASTVLLIQALGGGWNSSTLPARFSNLNTPSGTQSAQAAGAVSAPR
ncbi:MAG TPA: efflux transporter outer membrane subunit [Terriglobales bacterium]|nr:efflux transporter outer membrane subunit [Terriglobales bacterium]